MKDLVQAVRVQYHSWKVHQEVLLSVAFAHNGAVDSVAATTVVAFPDSPACVLEMRYFDVFHGQLQARLLGDLP